MHRRLLGGKNKAPTQSKVWIFPRESSYPRQLYTEKWLLNLEKFSNFMQLGGAAFEGFLTLELIDFYKCHAVLALANLRSRYASYSRVL
jgi:hypothetical protein